MRSLLRWSSIAVTVVSLFMLAMDVQADDEKWVSLFDGESMEGWEKVGKEGSEWKVKDGRSERFGAGFDVGLHDRAV